MQNNTQEEAYTQTTDKMSLNDVRMNGGVAKRQYEVDYMGVALFLMLFLAIATLYYSLTNGVAGRVVIENNNLVAEGQKKPSINYFDDVVLEGTSAFVWDINNATVLFAQNEETQLPLASITKLMTVVVANKYISPNDTIVVREENLNSEGDSGLFAFEEWRAKDLIDFTLMVSSNDGANVLASAAGAAKIVRSGSQKDSPEETFVEEMNKLSREFGLRQTYFLNETGLDTTKATSGGYGSARDVAILMAHVVTYTPNLIDSTVYSTREISSLSNFVHTATNTNQNIGNIPGLIASKTGFTDLAGGNLVIAFDAGINRPIIISVLGSSLEGRFTDVERLVKATLLQLSQ